MKSEKNMGIGQKSNEWSEQEPMEPMPYTS